MPARIRATIIAIAAGAIALVVALLPVSFTTMTGPVGEETETSIPCGPALSAAFHRYEDKASGKNADRAGLLAALPPRGLCESPPATRHGRRSLVPAEEGKCNGFRTSELCA